MRLWLGIGERLGPFWAGVTLLSTRRQHPLDHPGPMIGPPAVNSWAAGCAIVFVLVVVAVATTLFVAFLVVLL